jgi:hypothetical protein
LKFEKIKEERIMIKNSFKENEIINPQHAYPLRYSPNQYMKS